MSDLVRTKVFEDLIYSKLAPFVENMPTDIISACKLSLTKLRDKREEQFISDVLNDLKVIGIKDLEVESFLRRLYLTLQVINKAQTQEKLNHFRKLIVNSALYEISDNDYELYNNIIDSINDTEFLILKYLLEIIIPDGKNKNISDFYAQTGLDKQKLKSLLQRLESFGLVEQEMTTDEMPETISYFGHPVLEVSADYYSNKKFSKYYAISQLGKFFLNFITLK